MVGLKVPTLSDLNFPPIIKELTSKQRGLVIVTGPTGSGKSTTLAAMINEINANRAAHIVTLEDPIEYLHKHNKSIINQREIGKDTKSYANALKSVLREDPDVILVGEMRDLETISVAITAAETGHLVFSTLHTIGAAKTVDRIIDVFPPYQQQQIKVQLAAVLKGVISQQLIPKIDGNGRVAALEVMVSTPAIQNMIREGKTHQIESSIQTGAKHGMKTMDMCLAELYKKELISYEDAMTYSVDKEMLTRIISL
ncbi:twitching motility protein [Clostridium tetanomorphum]|nr:twitching motility protein [Clostridium tetanomorphum]